VTLLAHRDQENARPVELTWERTALEALPLWILNAPVHFLLVFCILASCQATVFAQTPPSEKVLQSGPAEDTGGASKLVSQQISRLNDARYQVRQNARSVIEQNPTIALQVIGEEIQTVEVVVGVQLVDIVSGLALHSDLAISAKATELLGSIANDATSVGRGALNCLSAIADLQEEKAVDILSHYGARIAIQDFSLNGRLENQPTRLALTINNSFTGTDEDLAWIRFLKSVQIIYFRGKNVSPAALQAASRLKQLKAIRLQGMKLNPQQLLLFKDFPGLEHLGLSYVDVDDSSIPIITQLPITESIRLYGTKITEDGKNRLASHFEGLEVFRGSGGFLGISSNNNSTIVDRVTEGSAAHLAGLRSGDRILAINGIPVSNFDQLRAELAKYQAGDEIELAVSRFAGFRLPDEETPAPKMIKAVLQEES
jgi:PDZ domain